MTLLIEHPVDRMTDDAGRILFDLGCCFEVQANERAQVVGVIGGIGDHMTNPFQALDQATRLRAIAPLARRDLEADRQTERIDGGMDLRRQAAFRSSDGVSFKPPF